MEKTGRSPLMVLLAACALVAINLMVVAPAPPVAAEANEAPGNVFAYRAISAGNGHTCVLTHEATVKCWGSNGTGQLGLGDLDNRGDAAGEMGDDLPAVDLGTGRTAIAVSAGSGYTCALLDNATVKCWGFNNAGQLGLGDTANRGDGPGEMGDSLPAVSLGTGRTATAISVGSSHACALLDDATVKCWGAGTLGRLGLGDTANRGDAGGEMGDALPAVSLGTGRTATAVTTGTTHTCVVLDTATVKCWGNGASGRLGLGDTVVRGDGPGEMGNSLPLVALGGLRTATAITAGDNHTCVLLDNATVKCWGNNDAGGLGLGDTLHRGDVAGEMGDMLPAVSLGTGRTATAVTTGNNHTCAHLDNAAVKCWGNNGSGRLGLGDTANRGDAVGEMGDNLPAVSLGTGRTVRAVTAGATHNCARLDDNTVKCWGNNGNGRLGLGDTANRGDAAGEMGDALPAVALGTGRTAATISAGFRHTCALLDNGTVKCWGSGPNGQLGYSAPTSRGGEAGEMGDALPAVSLGTGRTATAVSAGNVHTCAVLDNGTVKCWGAGGRLGLGDTLPHGTSPSGMGDNLPTVDLGTGRTATAIAAYNHTCAILDNGSIKCWGPNEAGQLGQGDTATRGNAAGQMGDNLPAVDLGTGRTATAVSVGIAHTCAVLDNGGVKCWGNNGNGRLGLGDTANRGDAPGEMGDALPAVALGTGRTATTVNTGNNHVCARLDNGTVKCWGAGANGRLGIGDTADRGDGPGEMGDALPTVALGIGRTATTVGTGGNHSCARLDNGTAKCWGGGLDGRLGTGDSANRGDGPGEMGDALPTVALGTGRTATALDLGSDHSCARLDNGAVKCWGRNEYGQLGQGDTAHRGDGPGEMGDALLAVDLGSAAATGITGTVVDDGSAAPIAGAFVAVLRTDFSIGAATVADGSGNFSVSVPPGGYFPYLIDPSATHTAGFSVGDPLVTVPADTVVDADLEMAPLRGAISGTVTEEGTGDPIANALVFSLTNGGGAEIATIADNNGDYTLPGLRTGNHYVAFADPTGNHSSEFWPDSPNVPDATTLAVTAGGTTTADSELPTQTGTATGSLLTGTIVETGTLTPLEDVVVLALHATDFRLARAATTNAAGQYSLDVQAGLGYKLAFYDGTGLHNFEWHDNQPNTGLGTATTVNAPAATNAALDRNTGSVSGTVTDQASGDPLAGAWVFAIGPTGIAGGTVTAPNGTYTITGLAPGTYRATFVDPNGGRAQEYFNNSPDFTGATPYNITAGTNTPNINAALAFS